MIGKRSVGMPTEVNARGFAVPCAADAWPVRDAVSRRPRSSSVMEKRRPVGVQALAARPHSLDPSDRLLALFHREAHTMNRLLFAIGLVLAVHSTAWATWSVIAIDTKTGQVIIASATCVRQAGFPQRQPNAARDLMDVQAVIVPGIGVAACQAGVDNTRQNQMLVYNELKKGTPPPDILAMLKKDPDVERRQFGILLMPNGGTITARNNRVGFNGTGNSPSSL